MNVIDEKQQLLLKNFYRQEKIWAADHYLFNVVSGIVLFPAMILFIMPFQIWEGDYQVLGIVSLIELMGMELYIRQYCEFRQDGERKSVCEIIRYVPVSHRQLALYILKKLLKLCLYLTGAAVVCQVVFALAFLDTFSVSNLLVPILCCLVLPMVLIGSRFLWRK